MQTYKCKLYAIDKYYNNCGYKFRLRDSTCVYLSLYLYSETLVALSNHVTSN